MELQGIVSDCEGNTKEVITIAAKPRAVQSLYVFVVYRKDFVNEQMAEYLYAVAPTQKDAESIVNALISDYVEWQEDVPVATWHKVKVQAYEEIKARLELQCALDKLTAYEREILKGYFTSGGE